MKYLYLYDSEKVYTMIPESKNEMTHTSMDALVGTVSEAIEFFEAIGVSYDVILYHIGAIAAPDKIVDERTQKLIDRKDLSQMTEEDEVANG
jgi:hypothetical protein